MLEDALKAMQKELSTEKVKFTYSMNPDKTMIKVNYPPIDGYQKQGNLRFIKSEDKKSYEMQGDPWQCNKEFAKVTNMVQDQYQAAVIKDFNTKQGFTQQVTKDKDGKILITATRF
jgi:hypothetical protein